MIIVLEGPDLAGKTTLARTLQRDYDFEVMHRGPPVQHPLYEYEPKFKMAFKGRKVVLDRWHLGERIYGPILRGQSMLDDMQLRHIDMYLHAYGAIVVLCIPPTFDVLAERYSARGDDLIGLGTLRRIYDEYVTLIDSPFVTTVIRSGTPSSFADQLVSLAATHKKACKKFALNPAFRTYVGPTQPRFLVVSERRVTDEEREFDGSMVPLPDTGNHFMMRALDCGISATIENDSDYNEIWASIGFMNVNESSCAHFREAWTSLGKPAILANGSTAHNKLNFLNLPHGSVKNSRAVLREHPHDLDWYGSTVISALRNQFDLREATP